MDAGGLIAVDRGDRHVIALVARAIERRARVTVPATALAQVIRRPSKQARLARMIRHASTDLVSLDGKDATATGILLAASRTADIVDAHVIVCARRTGQTILTSDADDLRRLDPDVRLLEV